MGLIYIRVHQYGHTGYYDPKFGNGVSCEHSHTYNNVERASKISTANKWSIMKNISELKEETCSGGRTHMLDFALLIKLAAFRGGSQPSF